MLCCRTRFAQRHTAHDTVYMTKSSAAEQISSLALLAGSVWSTSFSGTMAASHSIMENYDSVSTHTGAHFCLTECVGRSNLTKPFKGEVQPARVRWDVSRLSRAQTVQ